VFYANETLPQEMTCSVFLMGPTPRGPVASVPSWRIEALRILEALGFQGEVMVPEPRDGRWPDYATQIAWEDAALQQSDRIMVWLPLNMDTLPGLTTNDEWGYWKARDPARLILGTPADAQHVRCQHYYAQRLGIPIHPTLEEACNAATADHGTLRHGGECQVPLHIWRTEAFQAWHVAQKKAGNVLHGARVEWVFQVKPAFVFYWSLHVNVFVTAEGRNKTNEVIIGRPDIVAVVLFHPGADLLDTDAVLIREFRSPSRTPDGHTWELPSGSSIATGQSAHTVAVREVQEEVGLLIDPRLLRKHEARQFVGAMSVHQAQVFSVELTPEQIANMRAEEQANTQHGGADQSEITSVRVRKVREILAEPYADWSTVGMILAVLRERLGAAHTV
jgi:8-oxo-dGTP pyrophosphatase MutT (NUDIX family)